MSRYSVTTSASAVQLARHRVWRKPTAERLVARSRYLASLVHIAEEADCGLCVIGPGWRLWDPATSGPGAPLILLLDLDGAGPSAFRRDDLDWVLSLAHLVAIPTITSPETPLEIFAAVREESGAPQVLIEAHALTVPAWVDLSMTWSRALVICRADRWGSA